MQKIVTRRSLKRNIIENGQVIDILGRSLNRNLEHLCRLPGLLKRVIVEDMYLEFTEPHTHRTHKYDSFEAFVEAPILEGLGTTVETLRKACQDNTAVVDLIDEVSPRSRKSGRLLAVKSAFQALTAGERIEFKNWLLAESEC